MAKFTDRKSRVWTLEISVGDVERVRRELELDLLSALDGDLFTRLAADPCLLGSLLWCLLSVTEPARDLTPEEFASGLGGECLETAYDALLEALCDFFPPRRRALLENARRLLRETEDRAQAKTLAILNSPELAAEIDAVLDRTCGRHSTASPASAASTPAPTPSDSSSG